MPVSKPFNEDFSAFLQSAGIEFSKDDHLIFKISSHPSQGSSDISPSKTYPYQTSCDISPVTSYSTVIKLIEAGLNQENTLTTKILPCITIYEDEWITKRKIIIDRLLAVFGRGKAIFARNCSVRGISTEQARAFLNENHMLGYARSRYKYGLFAKRAEGDLSTDTLVCVATFSQPRTMNRGGVPVESFEWVRYAGLGALRVTGGMGKLMNHFINQVRPQEIMSYADIDWSTGASYVKLGFKLLEKTKPIEFFVEKSKMKRFTKKQLHRIIGGGISIDTDQFYSLRNQGNLKFIRSSTL